ncbi:MAG: ATP-dependent DNA helicase RecQ [Bacteroidaceae bacterium]
MSKYLEILKKYWGFDDFRGVQREIIESVGNGQDTLGLMPTGGGKSITFQVPALAKDGICIVITPLIALMKDQVANLRSRGILAAAIFSGMKNDEVVQTLDNAIFGGYKFLYISPERLGNELFCSKLTRMSVNLITVDESHCISQWGYDFRPAYLQIAKVKELLPDTPILALTATATTDVVIDIQKRLLFKQENCFRMSFERTNLSYVVRETTDKMEEAIHILKHIEGSAIIYVRSRSKTKDIENILLSTGISATSYHAGLNNEIKDMRQRLWQENEVRVMVSTNAFGMGIDKPDVRCVIHVDTPDSIEAYFQEAGRAGRDGKKAYAILLRTTKDAALLRKRIAEKFPELDYIKEVYENVCQFLQMAMGDGYQVTRRFDLDKFCVRYKLFPIPVISSLTILGEAGWLLYQSDNDNRSRMMITVTKSELSRLDALNEEQDTIIRTLLRKYTGLFSEYVTISESLIAKLTDMTREQIYEHLKTMDSYGVVSYIPAKKTATVKFLQRREEKQRITIPKEVYQVQLNRYKLRIEAMIAYLTEEKKCRSRLLLYYFGEKSDHNCGQCDVCLAQNKKQALSKEKQLAYQELIVQLIDESPTPVMLRDVLRKWPELNHVQFNELITKMRHKNIIELRDGCLFNEIDNK